ncbi:hypothetical protein MRBLMI12_002267 [Microbacterium sp. LMI12-1-1.1]|uniref:hypothetical protein n=1 Tax=Microbacterium sp. LMI12-1-1.1 TaxID=3135225 RepID=UPI0034401E35
MITTHAAHPEARRHPEVVMQRSESVLRWIGAIGIALAPFCIFVIPGLMYSGTFETNEEQFRAIAEGSHGGYEGQVLQIFGAVFVMAAALGIGGFVIARGRGRTLGVIGLIIGMLGAITLLLVLGFESAVLIALKSATDTDAAVATAVALFNGPVFLILLMAGLGGYSLALPILALALWRSGVLPIIVPLLFLLPPLFSLIPFSADVPYIVLSLLVLLPCVWATVQLIRPVPVARVRRRAGAEVSEPT